jgi:predicted unusual protein kinase regulating ubiquinone biosynthesis (AarF/ABC1/UbiB family)
VVDPRKRKRYSRTLSRLCGNSGILPTSHIITGVETGSDHPVAHGGFGEVWKGRYKNRIVAIKVMRPVALKELEKMKKVQLVKMIVNGS